MKWRPVLIAALICAAVAVIALWVIHSRQVGYWFQVHTGINNESGSYYGFWSGFGSDIEEFGILGAIGAGIYQLVKSTIVTSGVLADRAASRRGRPVPALLSASPRLPGQKANP